MGRKRDLAKQRVYERTWYSRHTATARAKVKDRRKRILAWFRDYKAGLQCIRCGESDPVTFDFHHRNPREKDQDFNGFMRHGWGIKRIVAELAKCDVLCASCHRKVHRDLREGRKSVAPLNLPVNCLPFVFIA